MDSLDVAADAILKGLSPDLLEKLASKVLSTHKRTFYLICTSLNDGETTTTYESIYENITKDELPLQIIWDQENKGLGLFEQIIGWEIYTNEKWEEYRKDKVLKVLVDQIDADSKWIDNNSVELKYIYRIFTVFRQPKDLLKIIKDMRDSYEDDFFIKAPFYHNFFFRILSDDGDPWEFTRCLRPEVKELDKLQCPNSTDVTKYVWTCHCYPPHLSIWRFIQKMIAQNKKPEKTADDIMWEYDLDSNLGGPTYDIDYMSIIKKWNGWVAEYQFLVDDRPKLRQWSVNFYWCLAGHYIGCGKKRKQCPKCRSIVEKTLEVLSRKDDSLFALFPQELICEVINHV